MTDEAPQVSNLQKVAELMASEAGLVEVQKRIRDKTLYMAPTQSAAGMETPELSEEVEALLIINGLHARFCGNYWQLNDIKRDINTGVPLNSSYDEWEAQVKWVQSVVRLQR